MMMATMQALTLSLGERRMAEFDQLMRGHGYRPPVRADLVSGAELLMVEVERFMEPYNQGFNPSIIGTKIRLDEEAIKPSDRDPENEVVYYHCIMPAWDGQCFVHLDDFTAVGCRKGCYANDTRWVIKLP